MCFSTVLVGAFLVYHPPTRHCYVMYVCDWDSSVCSCPLARCRVYNTTLIAIYVWSMSRERACRVMGALSGLSRPGARICNGRVCELVHSIICAFRLIVVVAFLVYHPPTPLVMLCMYVIGTVACAAVRSHGVVFIILH